MIFGIVVEAERDSVVYSNSYPEESDLTWITCLRRPCQDVVGVRRQFVDWLKHFQWHSGYLIGKALVIRDSDCHDSRAVENELVRILDQSAFREKLTAACSLLRDQMHGGDVAAGRRGRCERRRTDSGKDPSARALPKLWKARRMRRSPLPADALPKRSFRLIRQCMPR